MNRPLIRARLPCGVGDIGMHREPKGWFILRRHRGIRFGHKLDGEIPGRIRLGVTLAQLLAWLNPPGRPATHTPVPDRPLHLAHDPIAHHRAVDWRARVILSLAGHGHRFIQPRSASRRLESNLELRTLIFLDTHHGRSPWALDDLERHRPQ